MGRHLSEILLEQKTKITTLGKDGTYIGVHFSTDTQDKLIELANALKVPKDGIVERSKMHCTVVYSRKAFKDFTVHGKISEPWIGTPTELEIFETRSGSRAGIRCCFLFPVADTQIDSCWNRLRSLVGPRDRLGHCDCMGFAWSKTRYEGIG
jgi:hypothetical protein